MSTAPNQHDARAYGQAADQWCARNVAVLDPSKLDTKSVRLFASHLKPSQHVLEIGCANGYQLARLCTLVGCEGSGIDLSARAIADGVNRFPGLKLAVGTSRRIGLRR